MLSRSRSVRGRSSRSVRAAVFDTLEKRQLLSGLLPNVPPSPGYSLDYPRLNFDSSLSTGDPNLNAAYTTGGSDPQLFHVNAPLLELVLPDGPDANTNEDVHFIYPVQPDNLIDPGVLDLRMHIDSSGNLVPDAPNNLVLSGFVDMNDNGAFDAGEPNGTLLRGTVTAVGSDFTAPQANGYYMNFRFTPTAGDALSSYFTAKDIGMSMVLNGITPPSFAADFTRPVEGALGAIPQIPHVLPGAIRGMKFEDLNGNGTKDDGESGLDGWTIQLLDASNNLVDTQLTGVDGSYSFTGVQPGTYHVREVGKNGWIETTVDPADVTIVNGNQFDNLDFGNFKLGSISGTKFEDTNGNGVQDSSETSTTNVGGWTIYLDLNGNESNDSNEPSTTTDSNGNWTISGLKAGTYAIREVGKPGWIRTSVNPSDATITSGKVIGGKNLGNFKLGSISGLKFNDCNGNKVQDGGELGLQGWTINLVNSSNVVVDTMVTGSDGSFTFSNVGPGTYHLIEVGQTGWTQTVAPGDVVMLSGLASTGNAFGNKKSTSMICGIKFEDHDGDGVKDPIDHPLAGWTIYLDLNNNGYLDCNEPYDVTDASGSYCLTVNRTGTYKVREVTKCGWTQTLGKNGYSVYVSATGPDYTGYDFGNFDNISICGHKFYDGNVNGKDDECMWVQGLRINLYKDVNGNGVFDSCVDKWVDSTRTDCYGNFCFGDVGPGTYFVQEDLSSLCGVWIKTFGGAGYTVNATSGTNRKDIKFGNVKIGGTGAEDICYWTSCYGENKIFDGCSAVSELMLLNSLNLSNSKGALPNFSISGSGSYGLCQLSNWLESANSSNMAYELSAQFAIMELNVEAHLVSGTDRVYAPQLLPFASNVNGTPGLVDGGINPLGFMTIRDLLTATNYELGKDPTTITSSTARAYQTALEQVLELANEDKIFVQ